MSLKSNVFDQMARENFNKAKSRATISTILNFLSPARQNLLSLQDVKDLLKPSSESYQGLQTVDIDKIIGSEGRYQDFNKAFLPKFEYIRHRWENIDKAHLSDIILPPIKLYEIGGVYFVRDGNHRVSVAKAMGAMAIDAEVISLGSEITIDPDMTKSDLEAAVVRYERDKVFEETGLYKVMNKDEMVFTATGRYIEVLRHIRGHKYFMNLGKEEEISFIDAAESWYNTLYKPIVRLIEEEKVLLWFPGRTSADLYVWIIKHWHYLKEQYGNDFSLRKAVKDFKKRFGTSIWSQIKELAGQIVRSLFNRRGGA